jgi:hypothetical protein
LPDIPQPENLSTYIRDLERRIRLLETAPRLQNSSVANGTTTVVDGSGVVKTQFGLLSDETYGLAVVNPSGNLVNVNNTLFPKYGFTYATQNVTATTATALPSGPSVTATIGASGLALVSVFADIGLNQANQTGYIGFINSTTGFIANGWLSITSASAVYPAATSGKSYMASGLPTGSQTFQTAAYVSTGNVNFSAVTIIVQPF